MKDDAFYQLRDRAMLCTPAEFPAWYETLNEDERASLLPWIEENSSAPPNGLGLTDHMAAYLRFKEERSSINPD